MTYHPRREMLGAMLARAIPVVHDKEEQTERKLARRIDHRSALKGGGE